MSREIKFRAWDIKNKRFVNIVRLILDQFGVLDYADVVFNGKIYKLYHSEIVLEQYTMDKDQYNTPICKGDIVRICETDIGEVIQDYDGKWIILSVPKDKLRDGESVLLGNLEKLQKWRLADILSKEYCSVIGNIHENPELLGGEE